MLSDAVGGADPSRLGFEQSLGGVDHILSVDRHQPRIGHAAPRVAAWLGAGEGWP